MAKRKGDASQGKQPHRTRAVTKQSPAAGGRDSIYQVKISLTGIKPPIWRRVQVKDCTLAVLHDILQTCMGWEDYHLHVFEIGGEQFGLPEQWQ
jgi:hypothetical protein